MKQLVLVWLCTLFAHQMSLVYSKRCTFKISDERKVFHYKISEESELDSYAEEDMPVTPLQAEDVENIELKGYSAAEYFEAVVQDTVGSQIIKFKLKKSVKYLPDGLNPTISLWSDIWCNGESTVTFSCEIDAVNNQKPEFDENVWDYTLQERLQEGYVLNATKKIVITDQDRNNDMRVELKAGGENFRLRVEKIPETTVDIYDEVKDEKCKGKYEKKKVTIMEHWNVTIEVKQNLEYKKEGYLLQISAHDSVNETPQDVRVTVTDIDDKDPIFEEQNYYLNLNVEEKNGEISIKEIGGDSGIVGEGSLRLQRVTPSFPEAHDQDLGLNTVLNYEVIPDGSGWYKYFEFVKDGKQMSLDLTKVDPKFLNQDTMAIQLKSSQVNDPKRVAYALLNVALKTTEINLPTFEVTNELVKATKIGEDVFTIKPLVPDGIYEMTGTNADMFKLEDGIVKLNKAIPDDMETGEIELQVKTKTTVKQKTEKIKVTFKFVDLKSIQKPIFKRSVDRIDVWTNSEVGKVVKVLEVMEDDLEFKFELTDPDVKNFKIDQTSGTLTLLEALEEGEYSFKVKATVPSEKGRSDNTTVIVRGIGKQKAIFEKVEYQMNLFSDVQKDQVVFQLKPIIAGAKMRLKSQLLVIQIKMVTFPT